MKRHELQVTGEVLESSNHARDQLQQRGLQEVGALLIQAFGVEVEDGFVLTGQPVNEARDSPLMMLQRLGHLVGSTLIEGGGTVITTYRSDKIRIYRLQAGHVGAA